MVEQSIALLHWFRRLRVRWEIREDIHHAFLRLACAIICWRDSNPHDLIAWANSARRSHTTVSARAWISSMTGLMLRAAANWALIWRRARSGR